MKSANSGSAAAARFATHVHPPGDAQPDKILVLSLEAANPGTIVLHCQGQVIFRSEACALSSLIAEVLPAARRMVVDLAGVTTLDSGALGELVLSQMWADAAGYYLKFSSSTDSVRKLFEATNLASVFDVYATVEGALAAMQREEVPSA
jgi:anti-anti-sigma factor